MEYQTIDNKSKELYCKAQTIEESENLIESRFKFWNSMNNLAMQNMMYQMCNKTQRVHSICN